MRKFLVMLLLVPCMANASNWTVVHAINTDWSGVDQKTFTRVPQHSVVSTLVDRDSIVTNGDVKQVWWKRSASANGYYLDLLFQSSFDCHNRTVREDRVGGRTRPSEEYLWYNIDQKTPTVIPDTPEEVAFNAVCMNRWKP